MALPLTKERRGSATRPLFPPTDTSQRIQRKKEVQLVDKKILINAPATKTALKRKHGDSNRENDVYGSLPLSKEEQTKFIKTKLSTEDDNEDAETSYWQLVRKNRPFRFYLTSCIASYTGEWLTYLASISAIEEIQLSYGMEKTSRTAISALIIVRLIPNVLMSPFGGVLADEVDRRKSMIALDSVGALVALLFIVAFDQKSIGLIYLATFLQECVAGLYEPCRQSIIPLLVPRVHDLQKAVTIAATAEYVMAALGSALGGFLVAVLGIRSCYWMDSVTYLLSASLMSMVGGKWNASELFTDDTNLLEPSQPSTISGMLSDGIEYLKTSFFGSLVFLKFSAAFVYGAMDVLIVNFSERGDLDGRSARLGLLFACAGVGSFIGPLLAERWFDMDSPKTLQLLVLYSILLISMGCLLMGILDHFWMICFLSALRAVGQSIVWVYSSLLLQKFSDADLLGRVMSADYALALLAESFSALIAGILQDAGQLSAEDVAVLFGILGLIVFIIWMIYHRSGGGAASCLDNSSTATTSDASAVSETSMLITNVDGNV